jgi:mRNA-degrading endonuclease RelE of RelBE toxin-antitoxin system
MLFVELAPFVEFRERHWSDEELAVFQRYLLAAPDVGNLIPGTGGLRKARWLALGRGKRGGARVIYYWHIATDSIYLIHGYTKNRRDDLTKLQLNAIRRLLRDVING